MNGLPGGVTGPLGGGDRKGEWGLGVQKGEEGWE